MVLVVDLVVDWKDVDHFTIWYSQKLEIKVLETVFPREYWSNLNPESETWFTDNPNGKSQPPIFDFVKNEKAAMAAMKEYFESTEDLYEDAGPGQDPRPEWEQKFWKFYKSGMKFQMQGEETRVSIG
jgi:hypothetical protein